MNRFHLFPCTHQLSKSGTTLRKRVRRLARTRRARKNSIMDDNSLPEPRRPGRLHAPHCRSVPKLIEHMWEAGVGTRESVSAPRLQPGKSARAVGRVSRRGEGESKAPG